LILAGDGQTELARSVQKDNGTYAREYPEGPVYSNVVGYWSPRYGASGIEIGQNNNLSGAGDPDTLDELLNQISGGPQAGNDVTLTLDPDLQRLAYDQLAQSSTGRGSAVALNPKTGEILAMVSYPSYDPNNIDDNFEDLANDPKSPLLNRATQGLYPPGSTFKMITAAAALKSGVKPTDEFEDDGTYQTPGYTVYNYKNQKYGKQTFTDALTHSVNTIFAKVAVEDVGPEALAQTAYDFGFETSFEGFPIPVSPSVVGPPPGQWAPGNTAQIAFGQQTVVSNVFEMALVGAAIANGGTMEEPRLVREVRSPDGTILDKPTSRIRKNAVDKETAETLNDMMQHAVTDYETGAVIPGIKVAGKTGTAEASGGELHSWFVSFAPADDPEIVVAVLVENGQEGYKQAVPIARRLMETYLHSSGTLKNEAPQTEQTTPSTQQPAQPKTQTEQTTPSTQQPAQPKSGSPFQVPFQNPSQQKAPNPPGVPSSPSGKGQGF
jgi:peptidoglycan glycosyltransferase